VTLFLGRCVQIYLLTYLLESLHVGLESILLDLDLVLDLLTIDLDLDLVLRGLMSSHLSK